MTISGESSLSSSIPTNCRPPFRKCGKPSERPGESHPPALRILQLPARNKKWPRVFFALGHFTACDLLFFCIRRGSNRSARGSHAYVIEFNFPIHDGSSNLSWLITDCPGVR